MVKGHVMVLTSTTEAPQEVEMLRYRRVLGTRNGCTQAMMIMNQIASRTTKTRLGVIGEDREVAAHAAAGSRDLCRADIGEVDDERCAGAFLSDSPQR